MSLVSSYESPYVYEVDIPRTPVPTLAPHGIIVGHTFPSSAVQGANLPLSFDVHNNGTEGQIAFGIANIAGNPGNIVITYEGVENVLSPNQYWRVNTVNPVPNCSHIIDNCSIRFESAGNYVIKLWGMWYDELTGQWTYSSAEEITKNITVSTANGYPRTYTFFSNYRLKAQTWDRAWFGETKSASTGTPMPISAKLRYEVLYVDGTWDVNRVRIQYNGDLVWESDVSKGTLVSGEIDVTGRTLATDNVRIGVLTYLGEWDDVQFSVWIDYTYAIEPTEDPSEVNGFKEFIDKYGMWIALGVTGLAVLYMMRRPAMPIIVMPGVKK